MQSRETPERAGVPRLPKPAVAETPSSASVEPQPRALSNIDTPDQWLLKFVFGQAPGL